MSHVKLRVWGDYACFTRPEMKVERVSYEAMTPSAARGVLSAIYNKPKEMAWEIEKIHVIKPIRFHGITRNEVSAIVPKTVGDSAKKRGYFRTSDLINVVESRTQRHSLVLRDVEYVIEASIKVLDGSHLAKHVGMFKRRASKGQCFNTPYLGCREFSAGFELVEQAPESAYKGRVDDLGIMLYDMDYERNMAAMFFRAMMVDGVIDTTRAEV